MKPEQKIEFVNSLPVDLKAEFLVSCMLEEGFSENDILVSLEGTLKRKWSTDISHSETESFENGDEAFTLFLNRAGIYDTLPEALFHRFSESRSVSGGDMAKESMRVKAEEKEIRKFFRPFENEIFYRKTGVIQKENRQLKNLYIDFLNGLIPGFWKIDKEIPYYYASRLIKYIPHAGRIAGDFELTSRCLENIIGEKVSITHDTAEPDNFNGIEINKGAVLGMSSLGNNTVTGKRVAGFVGRLIVNIGPLKQTPVKDFFSNGKADLLLSSFYSYFVPVELDVETNILPGKERRAFILNPDTETESPVLGYNTIL